MPRRARIRDPLANTLPPLDSTRHRAWISHWKEWAIGQLPESATATLRSQLRLAIERALGRHGPDDPADEIRDLVQATLEPVLHELTAKAAETARGRQKHEVLEGIPALLEFALALRPGPRTAAMLSRPEYGRPVLSERLKRRIDRDFTGDESLEDILSYTVAFVDRCLAKQPPPPRRLARRLANGMVVTVGTAAKVLEQNPDLTPLIARGVGAGQQKVRAFLAKIRSQPESPKP